MYATVVRDERTHFPLVWTAGIRNTTWYWSTGLGHADEGLRDECTLFNHKDCWDMEHNPQQWFVVYATVVWVECTHFPPL